jgi:hypothetical protein
MIWRGFMHHAPQSIVSKAMDDAGFIKNRSKPNSFLGKIGPTADGNRPPGRLADLGAE